MTTTTAEAIAARRARNGEQLERGEFDSNMAGYLHEWGLTTLGVLQLTTAEQLSKIPDVGQGRIDRAVAYLGSRDQRRLRGERESLAVRICTVYGHAGDVPVNVLPLYVTACGAPIADIKQVVLRLNTRRIDTLGKLFMNHANVSFFERVFDGPTAALWMRAFLTPLFM